MKNVSAKLQALLTEYMKNNNGTLWAADLYEFTLNSGRVLRYTGHDTSLIIGGNLWKSWPIDRGDISEERGVKTTEMDMAVYFGRTDEIIPYTTWYIALQSGMFDNCYLSLDRVYSPTKWNWQMPAISSDYVLKGRFVGRIDVADLKLTSCQMSVSSALELLNTQIPRNLLMPSCINCLFDEMCGINKAAYIASGTVGNGSTRSRIVTGLGSADGHYAQGTITFTSGKNADVVRTINTFAGGTAALFLPTPFNVGAGDTFTITPGCDKLRATCAAKYNNINNFRGAPYVPVPESVL